MTYGGVAEAEQEVTIRFDRATGQAHLCSTWPTWSRKLERIYGSPKRVTRRDGDIISAFWVVPLTAIRVGRRRTGRPMTSEERSAAAARLQKGRLSRDSPPTTGK